MSIRSLLCSGLALTLCATLPLTAADSEAHAKHQHPGHGEHRLSDEQIAAINARLADRPQLLARIDQNGDGQLSRGELIRARALLQHHRGEGDGSKREHVKERFDLDGDGSLSEAERAAAKEALAMRRDGHQQPGDGALRERIKERADTNGDGTLDESERAAAKAALEKRIAERAAKMKAEHPKLFAKLDRDGDGTLDPQELRLAKALHQRRQHAEPGVRDHGRGEGRARSQD